MRTPNQPDLPLCCALAAQPERHRFKAVLWNFLQDPEGNDDALHGMLTAYEEIGVLTTQQCIEIGLEMRRYIGGATA